MRGRTKTDLFFITHLKRNTPIRTELSLFSNEPFYSQKDSILNLYVYAIKKFVKWHSAKAGQGKKNR